jgi:4-amino-4-deoxy-L-arabinose transferase-like glycosyltransferase
MSAGDLIHSLRGAPATAGRPAGAGLADAPASAGAFAGGSARTARAGRAGSTPADGATERAADPSWARPALVALLALTALAYMWDLSASGYANSFYAAAVQAGTKSWKAFFFGSLDSSNFITVDKPPASLWVMALSGRIFGFSSASMLVPQALEGVAAVGLLYAAVKRWFGAGAGLVAGAVFALTPVAALMFRFNNPDALLVLLLVAAAYCLVRAIERAGTRWVLAAGTMIGFAFLAKMMQAFLVLPAFALVYVIAAPTTLRRRIGQLLLGGVAVLVSAGWWVAIVALWPASDRPFIDGSPDNSIINLIFGYNGLGRIFGSSGVGGGPGNGGGGANFSGASGPLRLFNDLMGGQASWLLPAALLSLAGGLWARRRAPRTDRIRAALVLWGGWLLVTAAVFSFGQGVIHTYYTVALAPAIGALVAIGAALCWAHRDRIAARLMAALAVAASAGWAYALLERTPSWEPWLRPLILTAAALGVLGLVLAPVVARAGFGAAAARRLTLAAAVLGAVAAMAGPLAYAADTIATAHTGSIPSAGPANAAGMSAGGRGGAPGGGGGTRPSGFPGGAGAGTGATSGVPGLFGTSSTSSGRGGKAPAGGTTASRGGNAQAAGSGNAASGFGGGAATKTSAALVKALQSDASKYRWVAATSGSQSAATLELASGEPVMGIGGFNNEGGSLTLAAFKAYIAKGDIHYYVASSGGGVPGGSGRGSAGTGGAGGGPDGGAGGSSTSSITSWVQAHYMAETIGGQTVYNLA